MNNTKKCDVCTHTCVSDLDRHLKKSLLFCAAINSRVPIILNKRTKRNHTTFYVRKDTCVKIKWCPIYKLLYSVLLCNSKSFYFRLPYLFILMKGANNFGVDCKAVLTSLQWMYKKKRRGGGQKSLFWLKPFNNYSSWGLGFMLIPRCSGDELKWFHVVRKECASHHVMLRARLFFSLIFLV